MAVPKRKLSRSRTRRRRASNWTTSPPARSVCPQCQAVKLPHVVCPQCGWYGGRQAVEPEF
ncbi:MAG: 50S ribosomal protein L32 [Actinobacteria bacterium]|nr:50S ribosomal protein L32 [Actinomycetota bacterium]